MLDRPIWTGETDDAERRNVLAAMAAAGCWVKIYFGWRPNLHDSGDDHSIELAIAGGAQAIITHNVRDLGSGELRSPSLSVFTPRDIFGATLVTVLTARLPNDTGKRLKQLASARRISVNKLLEELSVAAPSAHDAETRFRASAVRADREAALTTLDRLDEQARNAGADAERQQ